MGSEQTNSIFDGVDQVIDECLGLDRPEDRFGTRFPKYKSRRAAIALAVHKGPLRNDVSKDCWGSRLIAACLKRMGENLDSMAPSKIAKSNWKWEKSLHLASHSKSEEKTLEKIVAFLLDDNWMNQMVVCNGLHGKGANACRVDVVHRTSDSAYDLIELKYSGNEGGGANHPLYAAMEILRYGLVYMLFRKRRLLTPSTSPRHHILSATEIRMVVLAPPRWYCYRKMPFHYQWLEQALTDGLSYAVREFVPKMKMSLVFEEMTPEFISLYMNLKKNVDAFREANLASRPVSFTGCNE